ncbi:hypothetical protein QTP88_009206 [Uroleucon formosanum]
MDVRSSRPMSVYALRNPRPFDDRNNAHDYTARRILDARTREEEISTIYSYARRLFRPPPPPFTLCVDEIPGITMSYYMTLERKLMIDIIGNGASLTCLAHGLRI